MADVSGIGGAEFSVAKGSFPTEENGRLNRPAREDTRVEDNTATPVRNDDAQAEQQVTQSLQTANDGDAQRNVANTGDFTAGGTDRPSDTVFISPEAQIAARTQAEGLPTATAQSGTPATAEVREAPANDRTATARPNEAQPAQPTPGGREAPSPAANAAAAADAAEPVRPAQTNQAVRDENSNAEVSGSESDQSEQTRTIGQVIDVFA